MTRPHVLYLLRYYPTLTETFVQDEIAGLVARGWRVTVAAMGTREDGALARDLPEVPVLEVPRRPWEGRLRPASAGMRWLGRFQRPKDAARLPWLASRLGDVDHIHVHFAGEAAEWACALRRDGGPPYSVTVHAVDLFKPRRSLDTVLAEAHRVLTVAEHHRRHLRSRGHESTLVRCGPVLADWNLPAMPSGPLRAAFIGRDVPKKGLDTLLAAWRPRTGDHLDIVSERQGIMDATITCHGLVPRARLREIVGRCNVIVLPCRQAPDGDLDGVPLVLMEALAAGRPVISTAVSGIPELIDPEVGWCIPPDDIAALRQALDEAGADETRQRRGAAGPARLLARGFHRDAQVEGLIDLIVD